MRNAKSDDECRLCGFTFGDHCCVDNACPTVEFIAYLKNTSEVKEPKHRFREKSWFSKKPVHDQRF